MPNLARIIRRAAPVTLTVIAVLATFVDTTAVASGKAVKRAPFITDTYVGKTSQGTKVSIALTRDLCYAAGANHQTTVERIGLCAVPNLLSVKQTCAAPGSGTLLRPLNLTAGLITAQGVYAAKTVYDQYGQVTGSQNITFTFKGAALRGTARVITTQYTQDGTNTAYLCDSGAVSFTATIR